MTAAIDHLQQLERSVIGSVLLRADNLALLPSLSCDDFASPLAKHTWAAIRNLETTRRPIDTVTLLDEMLHARTRYVEQLTEADRKWFDDDHAIYVGQCALACPIIDNAIEYARLLQDHALKSRLRMTLAELLEDAKSDEYTGAEVLSRALGGLACFDAEQPEDAQPIAAIIKQRLAQLDEIQKQRALGQDAATGFPTGIVRLDEKLGGIQPGIVTIVAARPAMGKSGFARSIADACSAKGYGAHVFSLEDTRRSYADRVMASESGVPVEAIRSATLARWQLEAMQIAVPALLQRDHWLFDDRSGITASEIVRSVRRHKRANKTRVVIVDYIQLVERERELGRANAHEVLTAHMKTFATAAKQDQIAYVVLSQLNRELEKRQDKRPTLSDLRESGSLEEHAKCVIALYRGSVYGEEPKRGVDFPQDRFAVPTKEQFERMVQILVLKNNDGQLGAVTAEWNGPLTKVS